MRELALFAGAGGGILGGLLLGWRTVCAVEIDPYCRSVLLARQRDRILAPFPIWDDVRTFDGKPWRGRVDVVSGGFPCQDISAAGKGAGITGERSGLWLEMARIIREVRPRFAFVENSPMLTSRGLGVVLGDLAAMGYDARWGVIGARDAGSPHRRDRIWILADSDENGRRACEYDASQRRFDDHGSPRENAQTFGRWTHGFDGTVPPDYFDRRFPSDGGSIRGLDGMAEWVDRVKGIGNGQCSPVVRLAWETLAPVGAEGSEHGEA